MEVALLFPPLPSPSTPSTQKLAMANENKKEFCAKTAIKSKSQGSLSNFHAPHTDYSGKAGKPSQKKKNKEQQ